VAKTLQSWGQVLYEHPIYGAVSPRARIHRFRNQEVEMGEMGVAPYYYNNPLVKFLLSIPTIWGSDV